MPLAQAGTLGRDREEHCMILTRYMVALESLASGDPDEVTLAPAPTLQRYLTGDIRG